MQTIVYKDAKKFCDDTIHLLEVNDVQNSLLIGNAKNALNGMREEDLFACVVDDGIRLIVTITPPFNLVLYAVDNVIEEAVMDCFVDYLAAHHIHIPGFLAEKEFAKIFAEKYMNRIGCELNKGAAMRIYRLDEISPNLPKVSGTFRQATESDMHFMGEWYFAFGIECGVDHGSNIHDASNSALHSIHSGNCYVWEDGVAVSTAKMGRQTEKAAIINGVYTPPYFRKMGYATACVAALSQKLLDDGYKYCSLFTDLANPISNSIYMQIGYYPICDYDEYRFE